MGINANEQPEYLVVYESPSSPNTAYDGVKMSEAINVEMAEGVDMKKSEVAKVKMSEGVDVKKSEVADVSMSEGVVLDRAIVGMRDDQSGGGP